MDDFGSITKNSKEGFFKYVFNLNEDSKAELLNLIQYVLLAVIPVLILNKMLQRYIPDAEEDKGSLVISIEVFIQILLIFIGLYYINKIIYYIPTYSGTNYPSFSLIIIVLPILLIILSLQTKLGEKISILHERLVDLWNGNTSLNKNTNNNNKKKVITSTQQQPSIQPSINSQAITQSLMTTGGQTTSLSQLPPPEYVSGNSSSSPSYPNYNNNDNNRNSSSGYQNQNEEIGGMGGLMAANEAFGSSFGSSF
jgi:hypothetical protein